MTALDESKGCAGSAQPFSLAACVVRVLAFAITLTAGFPAGARDLDAAERDRMAQWAVRYQDLRWNEARTRADLLALADATHPVIVAHVADEVRALLAADDRTWRKHRRLTRRIFPCIAEAQQLRALPDAEAYATAVAFDHPPQAPFGLDTRVVAIVPEGEELAYVLLRSRWKDPGADWEGPHPAVQPPQLDRGITATSFERTEAGWKLAESPGATWLAFALDERAPREPGADAVSTWCPPSSPP